MKKEGFVFYIDGEPITIFKGDRSLITQKNKIAKKYISTVFSLENGQRIQGYVKPIDNNGFEDYDFIPKEFRKALIVLNHLKAYTELIDEAPEHKTKGKYIIVNLTPEQEAELQKLKALCE